MTYNPAMPPRPDTRPAPAADFPAQPAPPAPILSSAQRSALRAQAHALSPVVMIGDAGLTEPVLNETERALSAHGLIKVRVHGDDRDARVALGAALSQQLGCALVQSIGKMLVLWRPIPDDQAARAPIRRRVATAPKKLAAEGKPAPAKRARPGVPRSEPQPIVTTRLRPAPRAARTLGPGSRTARGALDASVKPVGRGQGASPAPSGRPTGKRPQPVGLNAPARSPGRSPARGSGPGKTSAGPGKTSTGAGKAFSGAGTTTSSPRGPRPTTSGTGARRSSSSGTARTSGTARPGSRTRGPRRVP
jgi:RNA-binding protein